jgi:hypothetical protein
MARMAGSIHRAKSGSKSGSRTDAGVIVGFDL